MRDPRPIAAIIGMLPLGLLPLTSLAAEICTAGQAASYPCSHIDLLWHLDPAALGGTANEPLNDVWGWTDDDGREYALVGMLNGVAFVRLPLTDDGAPELLGRLPASDGAADAVAKCLHDEGCGGGSSWRDIKTWTHYAYVVSEASGHGVQIFDLNRLVGAAPGNTVFAENGRFDGLGHAHNFVVNETRGHGYAVGNGEVESADDGGLFMLDLAANPLAPPSMGEINLDGYVHDAQCVDYLGPDASYRGREICFGANEDTVTIYDVANGASDARVLSRTGYSGSAYTHQVWLSEDQRYLFVNDEVDEIEQSSRTHLRIFDVGSLDDPSLAAHYYAPTLSIDHNNYVHGSWLFQTNYTAGLRILDITDPLNPVEAAYFDTQPQQDSAKFEGTWSNFRLPSGRTLLSDIDDGLFIVKPQLGASDGSNLALALLVDGAQPVAGEDHPVEIQLSNSGTAAARDVLLTLHLGTNGSASVRSEAGASCSTAARMVECRLDELAPGASLSLAATVGLLSGSKAEAITTVYASAKDADATDNQASATLEFVTPTVIDDGGTNSGGGAFGWGALLMLASVAVRRRLRPG